MNWTVFPRKEPSRQVSALARQVEFDGGRVLAVYQDPVGENWQIFALLPIELVAAPPFQRNLSPTHLKRLTDVIGKLARFTDPILVVSPGPGVYWTPNGNHRRAALEKLRGRRSKDKERGNGADPRARDLIPAILLSEPEVGYALLALNTEKAPNLKDKSLEVIRLYRLLAEEDPKASEEGYSFQFESAHFITLGLLYESNLRFAGGAFAPILRRVDKFLKGRLRDNLGEREERAEMVREADRLLAAVVQKLKKRGLNHPFVKNFVLARTTPLTRARKTLPTFNVTFRKLAENLEEFDVSKVRYDDVARSSIMAAAPEGD
jgi:ParB family transcriptional regulator, chromosome partitioning protein